MLDIKPMMVTHDGKLYYAELGKINRTKLGLEDHGIFTFNLDFQFGVSKYQGAGNYNLNNHTNLGDMIQAITHFFGSDWEDLKGKRAFALREEHSGLIRGLMDEDQREVIIFADLVS